METAAGHASKLNRELKHPNRYYHTKNRIILGSQNVLNTKSKFFLAIMIFALEDQNGTGSKFHTMLWIASLVAQL